VTFCVFLQKWVDLLRNSLESLLRFRLRVISVVLGLALQLLIPGIQRLHAAGSLLLAVFVPGRVQLFLLTVNFIAKRLEVRLAWHELLL
jgi:hypothetical protein